MKRAVSPIKSSVLALSLFAGLIAGCGTEEPTPTPTPDPTPKPTTVAVTGVSLNKTALSLVEGTSETLTATVSPENASNKSVSWKSSATDVATVDDSGKVTAVKAGSATVTVSTADGNKTATCSVTVTEAAKIVITGNTAKVPVNGGTAEFPIQYNTSYTVEIESSAKEWLHFVETKAMQSGTLVFSVDANTGDARTGKATVKDNEGKVNPITLTFEQDPFIAVTSITLDRASVELEIGKSATLVATVTPSDATNKGVSWKSSDTGVATVDGSGLVTAVKPGSTTITVTTDDGGKTASCTVTVKEEGFITITGNTAKVPVEGGTAEFPIQYNTSYTVEIESSAQAWLHFVRTRAMQSGTLVFSVDANEGAARTGKATVKDNEGKVEPITLTFEQDPFIAVESVTLDQTELVLDLGEEVTLVATVNPDDATYKTVTWKSDMPGIVSVDASGKVTAYNYGEAVITAGTGDKTASCVVKVVDKTELRLKDILMEFYNAMDGPNWKKQENWGTDEWLGSWEGVQYTNSINGRRLELVFSEFGLKGEIPECIGDITELKSLIIRDETDLTGTLPQSFRKLSNLVTVDIEGTSMTSLADVFAPDNKFKWVFIYNNPEMTGPLPENLGASDELISFAVINNAFTGTPPGSWARLYKIGMMIAGNNLSGQIPKEYLTGEDVPEKLERILNQNPPGLDISKLDIKGCWPKESIKDVITGESFKFADVVRKNKYTVYLTWAPWCPFSKMLMPQLVDYYKQYHKDGLEVIATVMIPQSGELGKIWDDLPWQVRDIQEHGYDPWYNCYFPDYYESVPTYCAYTPEAEVYDSEGNILMSGMSRYPDPVRDRFGHDASVSLIPFLETLFGPAHQIEEYTSTDYSKDGEVITLQKATVGKGINLVFMGDAYVDRDMGKGGLYETLMKQSMEEFFAIEPFKTFRDRFNVYAVKVVSPNGWTGEGYTTALGAVFTHGSSGTGNIDKCFEYAMKVPGIKDSKNLMVSVLVNATNTGGITRMSESLQSGVAFTSSEGNNPEIFGMILRHEAGGHAFAFLDDEYSFYQGKAPQEHINYRNTMYEKYGWYSNVDFTNDPAKIKWSAFLADERYKDEVGIVEGGSLYPQGTYRPTEHSMMNDHYEYFNAPSRWAIYKRIMELSGETASFEKFLEYDAVNRGKNQKNSAPGTRSAIKIEHTPPVVMP